VNNSYQNVHDNDEAASSAVQCLKGQDTRKQCFLQQRSLS